MLQTRIERRSEQREHIGEFSYQDYTYTTSWDRYVTTITGEALERFITELEKVIAEAEPIVARLNDASERVMAEAVARVEQAARDQYDAMQQFHALPWLQRLFKPAPRMRPEYPLMWVKLSPHVSRLEELRQVLQRAKYLTPAVGELILSEDEQAHFAVRVVGDLIVRGGWFEEMQAQIAQADAVLSTKQPVRGPEWGDRSNDWRWRDEHGLS